MTYFQTEKDKEERAKRLSDLIIKMKNSLDNPLNRTSHKIYRNRKFRKLAEKEISRLGFKLDLETEILRKIILAPQKNLLREDFAIKQDNYIRTKSKFNDALREMINAKELYRQAKNIYFESRRGK